MLITPNRDDVRVIYASKTFSDSVAAVFGHEIQQHSFMDFVRRKERMFVLQKALDVAETAGFQVPVRYAGASSHLNEKICQRHLTNLRIASLLLASIRVKMINFMDPSFRKPRTRCRGTGSDPETCTCSDGVLFLTSVGNGLLGATFHILETVQHRCTCNEAWGPEESSSLLQAFATSSKCMDLSNFQFCNVAELGMVITTLPSTVCGPVIERPDMDTDGAAATIMEQMEGATEVSVLCLMSIKDLQGRKSFVQSTWSKPELEHLALWVRRASMNAIDARQSKCFVTKHKFNLRTPMLSTTVGSSSANHMTDRELSLPAESYAVLHQGLVMLVTRFSRKPTMPWDDDPTPITLPPLASLNLPIPALPDLKQHRTRSIADMAESEKRRGKRTMGSVPPTSPALDKDAPRPTLPPFNLMSPREAPYPLPTAAPAVEPSLGPTTPPIVGHGDTRRELPTMDESFPSPSPLTPPLRFPQTPQTLSYYFPKPITRPVQPRNNIHMPDPTDHVPHWVAALMLRSSHELAQHALDKLTYRSHRHALRAEMFDAAGSEGSQYSTEDLFRRPMQHGVPSPLLGKRMRRVCEECGVRDTPEWRRGPKGDKNFCNACGLKHARKHRREEQQRESDAELLLYLGNSSDKRSPTEMKLPSETRFASVRW
ncbi:hypothetical protein HK097_011692 [Rhizophlyctis rosea]|uniref:GATA-type domain-containing protein n=1 Tax=Rhizophlyctis rosea TaxID=64517 RepID=A0AAD5S8G3_9FUNG|nr:hypothetical protein HK097_011692 [Rhizophlyctis rosea]